MLNSLWNPRANVNLDKCLFDTIQDWNILGQMFESFNTAEISDKNFQALEFHSSTTGYVEKRAPRFTDVIHAPELIAELVVDNLCQVVTNSEEKELRKKNKLAAKKK